MFCDPNIIILSSAQSRISLTFRENSLFLTWIFIVTFILHEVLISREQYSLHACSALSLLLHVSSFHVSLKITANERSVQLTYSQWWYWCDQVNTIVYACWVLFPYATYYNPVKLSQLCQLYITSQARNIGMLSNTYSLMVNENQQMH
jgi:hypothetical protein